jgi:hypothetical protein
MSTPSSHLLRLGRFHIAPNRHPHKHVAHKPRCTQATLYTSHAAYKPRRTQTTLHTKPRRTQTRRKQAAPRTWDGVLSTLQQGLPDGDQQNGHPLPELRFHSLDEGRLGGGPSTACPAPTTPTPTPTTPSPSCGSTNATQTTAQQTQYRSQHRSHDSITQSQCRPHGSTA